MQQRMGMNTENLEQNLRISKQTSRSTRHAIKTITSQISELENTLSENETAIKKATKNKKKKKLSNLNQTKKELVSELELLQAKKAGLEIKLTHETQVQDEINRQLNTASETPVITTEITGITAESEEEVEDNENEYDKAVRLFIEKLTYDEEEQRLQQVYDYERPAIRALYQANRKLLLSIQAEKKPDRAYHTELLNAARELLSDYKSIDHQQTFITVAERNVNGKSCLPLLIAGIATVILGLALALACPPLYIMGYIGTMAMLGGIFGGMSATIAGCFIGSLGEKQGTARAILNVQHAVDHAIQPPLPSIRTISLFETTASKARYQRNEELSINIPVSTI